MKIAIISPRYYPTIGGGETYSYQLATNFAYLGHDVTVITNCLNRKANQKLPYKIREIHGLDDRKPDITQCLPELAKHFRENSYNVIQVNNYLSYFLFVNAVDADKIGGVVFCTNNTPNLPHTVFSTFGDYDCELQFARRLLDDGPHSAIISGSGDFADSIRFIANKQQRIIYVPYAVDMTRFCLKHAKHVRKKYKIADNEKLILSTSRFVRRKNLVSLIDALALLPTEYKLLLTGSAEPEGKETYDSVLKSIKQNKLEKRVILLQEVTSFDDLPSLYQAADVFAITSEREGFGISIIEAMSCKTPVVGTNVPGIRDLVKNDYTGLLVEYNNVSEIAIAIRRLATKSLDTMQLTQNAHSMVRGNYTVGHMVNRHLSVYETIQRKGSSNRKLKAQKSAR